MRLQASGDKVLCKLVLTSLKTKSGLFLPEQKPTQQAVVISVGSSFEYNLKPKDKIIVEKHGGIPLTHNNEDFMLYTKNEVLALVEA